MDTQMQKIQRMALQPTPTPKPPVPKPVQKPSSQPATASKTAGKKKQTDVVGAQAATKPILRAKPKQLPRRKSKLDKIMEKFKKKNWNKMSYDEQRKACEELSQYLSKNLGLKPAPKIGFYRPKNPNELGEYKRKPNTLYINDVYFDQYYYNPKQMVGTIAHETRHAYQHQCAENPKIKSHRVWDNNFYDYKTVEKDGYNAYRNQPVEKDAFSYGDRYSNYFSENI